MIELEKSTLEVDRLVAVRLVAGPGASVSSQSAAMPPAAWVGHVSLLLSDDLLSDDLCLSAQLSSACLLLG